MAEISTRTVSCKISYRKSGRQEGIWEGSQRFLLGHVQRARLLSVCIFPTCCPFAGPSVFLAPPLLNVAFYKSIFLWQKNQSHATNLSATVYRTVLWIPANLVQMSTCWFSFFLSRDLCLKWCLKKHQVHKFCVAELREPGYINWKLMDFMSLYHLTQPSCWLHAKFSVITYYCTAV